MSKFTSYLFLILTVINFASILGIYYLYQTKIANARDAPRTSALRLPDDASTARPNLVITETRFGSVAGLKQTFQSNDVVAYLGVPYAQPPLGRLRHRPPQEPFSWNGTVYEATNWPNPCLQPDNKLRLNNYEYSEDCLYLNIWTPAQGEEPVKKPVIVVIHTGAFIFGSASEATYNGLALASIGDLVVVTFNYRLNFYGFAYANNTDRVTPNVGMLDQVAVLQWLKANIANFNGDPERITLAGQSSGGLSVGMHITSPLSRGTFSQAIIMSGSPLQTPMLSKPEHVAAFWANYARHINCADSATSTTLTTEAMFCIREAVARNRNLLPTMSLVKKLSADSMFVNVPIVIDDHFQPQSQVELLLDTSSNVFDNLTLLYGYTNDEGSWIAALEDEKHFGPKATPNLTREEAIELIELYLGKMKTTKEEVNATSMIGYYLSHLYDIQGHDAKNDALVLSRLVSSLLGDHYISCPANLFANLLLGHSQADIYQYYWTYKGDARSSAFWSTFTSAWCGQWMGSCHSFEMFAMFGIPLLEPTAFSADDRVVSMKTIQMVSYFAHNRKLFWPKFIAADAATKTDSAKMYYIVDNMLEQVKFGADLKTDVCENIWQEYLL